MHGFPYFYKGKIQKSENFHSKSWPIMFRRSNVVRSRVKLLWPQGEWIRSTIWHVPVHSTPILGNELAYDWEEEEQRSTPVFPYHFCSLNKKQEVYKQNKCIFSKLVFRNERCCILSVSMNVSESPSEFGPTQNTHRKKYGTRFSLILNFEYLWKWDYYCYLRCSDLVFDFVLIILSNHAVASQ